MASDTPKSWLDADVTTPWSAAAAIDLERRLKSPAVLVKWYGAVGDGETDDTAAIQDAVDAAASLPGGTTVVFDSGGDYVVTASTDGEPPSGWGGGDSEFAIALRTGVHLQGNGARIQMAYVTSANDTIFGNTGSGITDFSVRGFDIDGMTGGVAYNEATHNGIQLYGACSRFAISDNRIHGFRGDGIKVLSDPADNSVISQHFQITGNDVYGCSGNAIVPISCHNWVVANNTFHDVATLDAGTEVIHSTQPGYPTKNLVVTGNTFGSWGQISLGHCERVTITGNVFQAAGELVTPAAINIGASGQASYGVNITGNVFDWSEVTSTTINRFPIVIRSQEAGDVDDIVIAGNVIRRPTALGSNDSSPISIGANGSTRRRVVIANNTIYGGTQAMTSGHDILVQYAAGATIEGNHIARSDTGTTARGVYVQNSTGIVVRGNYLLNCRIDVSNPDTLIEGNHVDHLGTCIRVINNDRCLVTGNRIISRATSTANGAIVLDAADNCLVTSNLVQNTVSSMRFLTESGASDFNFVTANKFVGTTGSVSTVGAGTSVTGNMGP